MKNIIITILVLVLLALGGFITYNEVINKDEQQKEINELKNQLNNLKQEKNTSNEIVSNNLVGEFEYIKEHSDQPGITSYIDLMEDGTFYKSDTSTAKQWWYGTYTIENETLTLKSNFTISNEAMSAQDSSEIFTYKIKNDELNDDKLQIAYTKSGKNSTVQKEFIEMLENIAKDNAKNAS